MRNVDVLVEAVETRRLLAARPLPLDDMYGNRAR
jgi:hypothetical protein